MKKLRMLHSIIYGIITVLLLILMLSVALLDSPAIPISILVSIMLFWITGIGNLNACTGAYRKKDDCVAEKRTFEEI